MSKVMFRATGLRPLFVALAAITMLMPASAQATEPSVAPLLDRGSIALGADHGCARAESGIVWCWGRNSFGELGDGTTTARTSPVKPQGVSRATSVSTGAWHSCATLANGTVQCWGDNGEFQLGDGSPFGRLLPASVRGLSAVTRIDSGGFVTCAVRADGTVWCWGDNKSGQLGFGDGERQLVPVQVAGVAGAVNVSVNDSHICAVLASGTVNCWGNNQYGQLGDGTTTRRNSPVEVSGIANAADVSVGGGHTCALLRTGRVSCWGSNELLQLGVTGVSHRTTAAEVSGLSGVVALEAGPGHSCVILQDFSARCWGSNETAELGIGFGPNRADPVTPSELGEVEDLAIGQRQTCAITRAAPGTLRCWGNWELPATRVGFTRGEAGIGNDAAADAQRISSVPFTDSVDLSPTSMQGNEPVPSCAPAAPQRSVWYRYRSETARRLVGRVTGGPLAVFTGQPGGLTEIACGSSNLTIDIAATQTYWLMAYGGSGAGVVQLSLRPASIAPNDSVGDASVVGSLPYSDRVDTTTATVDPTDPFPSCAIRDHEAYHTVWYEYTASESREVAIDWSGYLVRVGVYERNGDSLLEVACNDPNDHKTFYVEAGHTYLFQVRGHDSDSGWLTFSLSEADSWDAVAPAAAVYFLFNTQYTNEPTVTYHVEGYDPHPTSGVVAMAISPNPTGPWTWQKYSSTQRSWTFSGPDGPKSLYAMVRDAAGNVSPVAHGTIILDRGSPTTAAPVVGVDLGSTIGSTVSVEAQVNGADSLSGIADCDLSLVTGTAVSPVACENGSATTGITPGSTMYQFRGRTVDRAGNLSAWVSSPSTTLRLTQESAPVVTRTSGWTLRRDSRASGGRYLQSSTIGKRVTFKVSGRNLALIARVGPSAGKITVSIDGVVQKVDLYAAAAGWRRVVFTKSVASGAHTVVVQILSEKNQRSTGRVVAIDALATLS